MEYGGITPVGLPETWRVLVDSRAVVADAGLDGHPAVIIGSGVRRSKLSLPGALLARLPGADVVPDLAIT
jgi:prolyl-tRNA editing enzyme YbaK/EbsC (Cys-tRNA(Pro) deacylase)